MDKYFDLSSGIKNSAVFEKFMLSVKGTQEEIKDIRAYASSYILNLLMEKLESTLGNIDLPEFKSKEDIPAITEKVNQLKSNPLFDITIEEFFNKDLGGILVQLQKDIIESGNAK